MTLSADELKELRAKAEAAHKHNPTGVWTHGAPETWIWATRHDGAQMHIAGVRGWGELTGRGGGLALDDHEAIETQQAWGDHIAALNPATALSLIAAAELNAELVGALERLERANDEVAEGRSCAAYSQMLDDGQQDDLLALDEARAYARATLAKAKGSA